MTLSLRKLAKKALGITSWNSDEHQSRLITDPKTIFDVGANVGQSAKDVAKIQEYIARNYLALPMFQDSQVFAAAKYVQDLGFQETGRIWLYNTWLSKH